MVRDVSETMVDLSCELARVKEGETSTIVQQFTDQLQEAVEAVNTLRVFARSTFDVCFVDGQLLDLLTKLRLAADGSHYVMAALTGLLRNEYRVTIDAEEVQL